MGAVAGLSEAASLLTRRYATISAMMVALLFVTGVHAVGGDAGSGGDAGKNAVHALAITYGSYTGALSSASDKDWFRVADESSSPQCVEASLTPESAFTSTFYAVGPFGTRTVALSAPSGVLQHGGIAVPNLSANYLGMSGGPANYSFSMGVTPIVPVTGEGSAGADAGDLLSNALVTNASCAAGHLESLIDEVDIFSVAAAAGDTIYYSTAATGAGASVSILDGTGSPVGPTIAPGEMAGYFAENGGTYYLSVSLTAGSSSTDYVLGLLIGPDPPPSQGCRPTCLVST